MVTFMTVSLGVDIDNDGLLRLALALLESAFKEKDWKFLRSEACAQMVDFIIAELEK